MFVCLLFLGPAESHAGSAGQLDPGFGRAGKVTTAFSRGDSRVFGIAIARTGEVVAVGESDHASLSGFAVARYRRNGGLDRRFGMRGEVRTAFASANAAATAVVLQRDGRIVVAGPTGLANSVERKVVLARYTSTGALDPSFGRMGEVVAPFQARAMGVFLKAALALQSNGKIVVAGTTDSATSQPSRFAVARYNISGSLDHRFGDAGQVTTAFGSDAAVASAIALQPDGKIAVAGYSLAPSSAATSFLVARYNRDGSLDQTFGTGGRVITSIGSSSAATAIAVEPDGKIVVAGSTSPEHLQGRDFGLVRYDRNGALDTSFGEGGKVTTAFTNDDGIQGIAIEPDGNIVVAGSTVTRTDARLRLAIAMYAPDGSLDARFGRDGKVTTAFGRGDDQAHAVAIERDGKIVVGGESVGQSAQAAEFALSRYFDQTVCQVPMVKHKATAEARRIIVQSDCSVGRIRRAFSSVVQKGHVISQRPRAWRQRPKGAKVTLVLSKGARAR